MTPKSFLTVCSTISTIYTLKAANNNSILILTKIPLYIDLSLDLGNSNRCYHFDYI